MIRKFAQLFVLLVIFSLVPVGALTAVAESGYPYVQTFNISAYYSPLPGQNSYAAGSYEGDIRLNGKGTNGADGTPVYPGMIAAPSAYPFGTKMSIPGVGIVAVHDRGGAIVHAGERGQSYDRLDIWMGYGDEGLHRALTWGLKTVEVTVYGLDSSVEESVYLEGFTYTESIVKNVVLSPQLFSEDIWYQSSGEDVEELQGYLKELGYYAGEISGYYDDETREAVIDFQLAEGVIYSESDFGAGHTGVNTRKSLEIAVANMGDHQMSESTALAVEADELFDQYPDLARRTQGFSRTLSLGSSGDDVSALQQELVHLSYLRITPTGYYGELTEHSVFKLQQKWGILLTEDEPGAGVFGPTTRSYMNSVIEARYKDLGSIAINRYELESDDSADKPGDDSTFTRLLGPGDRGPAVKDLQRLLKKVGFFNGAFLTEYYGEQTTSAVASFQLSNYLIDSEDDPLAGIVDEATMTALDSYR